MSRLRAFFADYFGKGPGAPKYATGLEIPEDDQLPEDTAPKYAAGRRPSVSPRIPPARRDGCHRGLDCRAPPGRLPKVFPAGEETLPWG